MVFDLTINFDEPFDLFFLDRFLAFALLWLPVWFDFSISSRRKAIKVCLLWCSQNLNVGRKGVQSLHDSGYCRNLCDTTGLALSNVIYNYSAASCPTVNMTNFSVFHYVQSDWAIVRISSSNGNANSTLCSCTSIWWRLITFLRTQLYSRRFDTCCWTIQNSTLWSNRPDLSRVCLFVSKIKMSRKPYTE